MRTKALALAVAASSLAVAISATVDDGGVRHTYAKAALSAAETSSNWSGYVVTGLGSTPETMTTTPQFRNVTATWKQPTATCTASGRASASAIWVGLGGYSAASTALEQAGTSADCGADGVASYYAWYELIPAPSVTIKRLKIAPGDTITASVLVTGNEVLMQIKNRTRRTSFTKRVTREDLDLSSAEWIAEAPLECSENGFCQQVPLANFGSVTFTRVAAQASIGGLGNQGGTISSPLWQATPIELVPLLTRRYFGEVERPDAASGSAGASPLALAADGRSFRVSWVANPSRGG